MTVRAGRLTILIKQSRLAGHQSRHVAQHRQSGWQQCSLIQHRHRHAGRCFSCASAAVQMRSSEAEFKSLDGFFQRIAECNTATDVELVPFQVADKRVGYLRPEFAEHLAALPQFTTHRDVENTGTTTPVLISLKAAGDSQAARSAALAEATAALRERGIIRGWRDELYPITDSFHTAPLALIERAAAPHFGIKAYGVHVNGYVIRKRQLHLWMARRSQKKPTWPGLLDHIVAGGQPAGLSCMENVVKECQEEAGIPADLACTARPAGVVSYSGMVEEGLKRDVLFVYDILLPEDFQPKPQDGEVEAFELKPIEEVARIVAETRDFKPNCALVIIDFLVRHGVLTPELPGYPRLVNLLRSGDCS